MQDIPHHAAARVDKDSFRKFSWSVFTPSFFKTHGSQKTIRPTAYLDGLRGLAALLVYITHHIGVAHDFGSPLFSGFGADGNYYFITIPFLRVIFTGSHFAVPVFFVISGFVLSRGPIKLMHGKDGNAGSSLASAVFRRAIRLWLPVIGTTFTYMIIRHMGVWADWPKLQPSFTAELGAYCSELLRFTYVLRIKENIFESIPLNTFSYNPHTWTVALEVQGSILLFITLLAFSNLSSKSRMLLTTLLALYFNLQGSWVSFCFLSGAVLAEVDLLNPDFLRKPSQSRTVCVYSMLIVGLWLASMPTVELMAQTRTVLAQNPGWATLAVLVPSTYDDIKPYWLSWGAVALMFAISNLPWVRRFFETSFLQYLGKISFAFYLVHGPILQTLAVRLYHITGQRHEAFGAWLARYDNWLPLPQFGPLGLEFSFLACHLILLPITFYCAEIVECVFDAPSVKIARWCYQRLLA